MIYEELSRTNACYRSRIGTSNGIGSMGILFDGSDEQKTTCLPQNRIETFLRDARLYRIYEGTGEIQRIIISRNLLQS